ncbi:MAG: glutamate 5-kinase [Planctomycetaceae bacterium]|jgi:glutamate 5-kinase|nr:glutamate 5-kinase [Planctomycetaceae bacterium]
MYSILRDELIKTSDVIVVKVGTNVIACSNGHLNEERIGILVSDIATMFKKKKRVILVTSGAVGAGMGSLNLKTRPVEIAELQAVAAIGQGKLIEIYERFMRQHDVATAQVLLTADDFADRKRYLNVRNTIWALLKFAALPIINENDTVSVSRLHTTFGDNDHLASLVANLFDTPLLILLTDVDGLYDRDPVDSDAKLIPIVEHWTPDLMNMVAEKRSKLSKGGMSSKLRAAKIITESGGNVIIANGDQQDSLKNIFNAYEVGTLFITQDNHMSARKRWLGFAVRAEGKIVLDEGAIKAVRTNGKSLLPIGIVAVDGLFDRGAIVSLVDRSGNEIARGLTNYNKQDLLKIQGKKTSEIRQILGQSLYTEVIHRDNLQIVD